MKSVKKMMMNKSNIASNTSVLLLVVVFMTCFVSSFSCRRQGEICGFGEPCCPGLDCNGEEGCQPHCGHQGEVCGFLGVPCCPGLDCKGIKGCQPPSNDAYDVVAGETTTPASASA